MTNLGILDNIEKFKNKIHWPLRKLQNLDFLAKLKKQQKLMGLLDMTR